jgi:hypothetical protein
MPEQKSIVEWTCDRENALDLPRLVGHLNDRFNGVESMLDCRVVPRTDMRGRLGVPFLRGWIRGQVRSPSPTDETIAARVSVPTGIGSALTGRMPPGEEGG